MALAEPKRDRQTERREGTRREILAAAWEVADERGLAHLTLRDVGDRVGMRPPSLYSHFDSKNAIFDAMFEQAWQDCLAALSAGAGRPRSARTALKRHAHTLFDFAVESPARHQLMNQRTNSGYAPSPGAGCVAQRTLQALRERLSDWGITASDEVDLFVAVVAGLVDAQLTHDPGGNRWRRLVDRAVDMQADHLGL